MWDRASLEQRYRQNLELLTKSASAIQGQEDEKVGRETLLLGRAVTRDILLDPLLPAEMIDVALRKEMVDAMRTYDGLGKNYWRRFEKTHNVTRDKN